MPSLDSEPGLYLILPAGFDAARLAPELDAALASGTVAAVLLWPRETSEAVWGEAVDRLMPLVHGYGVPLLLGGDRARAGRLRADGVHLETEPGLLRAAVEAEKPRRMVGAGGLLTRHDAMLAGESGVDYVLFGAADPARHDAGDAARVLALTEWWAELFEVPCAAMAASACEAEALAHAGADFVAVRELVWNHPQGAAAAVSELARRLKTLAHAM